MADGSEAGGRYHIKRECNFCGETVRGKDLVTHAEGCRPDKIRTDMWFNHIRELFYGDTYTTDNDREGQPDA